jgi:hypothetical protein
MYAILYYGIHELTISRDSTTVRFINGISTMFWIVDGVDDTPVPMNGTGPNSDTNAVREMLGNFVDHVVNFLDLTLTLDHHRIVTRLYEPLNRNCLYTYPSTFSTSTGNFKAG